MNQSSYLPSAIKQFLYYKQLGEKTFEQLTQNDQITWQPNPESNSIGTIVKHICGNMKSRWTDFLTSDGEKEWRDRDAEFENDIKTFDQLHETWTTGWSVLLKTLNSLSDSDLEKIIHIRNQGHTVTEAINRQLCHYACHVGQIVYLGKMICGDTWSSLTIAKGASSTYNQKKFSVRQERIHYTDEWLNQKT